MHNQLSVYLSLSLDHPWIQRRMVRIKLGKNHYVDTRWLNNLSRKMQRLSNRFFSTRFLTMSHWLMAAEQSVRKKKKGFMQMLPAVKTISQNGSRNIGSSSSIKILTFLDFYIFLNNKDIQKMLRAKEKCLRQEHIANMVILRHTFWKIQRFGNVREISSFISSKLASRSAADKPESIKIKKWPNG